MIFLTKNNLPFRGHRDSGTIPQDVNEPETDYERDGVFRSAVRFRIDAGDSELEQLVGDSPLYASYMSPRIQNELIENVRQKILASLKSKFLAAVHFSILMDVTSDVSCREQVSVIIRSVDISGDVSEDFVGFTEGEDLTGRGLANHLLSRVEELGLHITNCRGQGYTMEPRPCKASSMVVKP